MSDLQIASRPALALRQPFLSADIEIVPLSEGIVIHVLGKAGDETLPAKLAAISGNIPHAVRPAGPAQWFIVDDTPKTHREVTALIDALPPSATGVDQSHGRVRIGVSGPMVERLLAKGTAVDLALSAFPIGAATTTLIGHIAAHVTRVKSNMFELMVLRGFAESLWDDLVGMAAEFA